MKKNIMIVTFQNAYNHGAMLQCFALQEKIKSFENDVKVLNYDNKIISNIYKIFYVNQNNSFAVKYIKAFIHGIVFFNQIRRRNKKFRDFIYNNINTTKLMSANDIKSNKYSNYDMLIVGSDQVWNTDLLNGFDDIYFLSFGDNIEKASYAASIGKTYIDENYQEQISHALSDFKSISLREESGKKAISKLTNKELTVDLDPTLLLERNEWDKYIPQEKIVDDKYILVYMPNQEVIKIADYISKKENIKIVDVDKKKNFKNEINMFDSDPLEFVNLVKNAEYIITSSFHATVFSVIYNKKFWVVPPKKISSRIDDLLSKLKLSNRVLKDYNDYLSKEKCNNIDYKSTNMLLNKEREKSIDNLKSIID